MCCVCVCVHHILSPTFSWIFSLYLHLFHTVLYLIFHLISTSSLLFNLQSYSCSDDIVGPPSLYPLLSIYVSPSLPRSLSHSVPSSLSIDLSLHPSFSLPFHPSISPFLPLTPISSLHLSLPPSHSLRQGLFLQRQAEVSKEFSVFMTSELLTPKKIWNEVSNGTTQCCTTLHYTALHYTGLHWTAFCSTILSRP